MRQSSKKALALKKARATFGAAAALGVVALAGCAAPPGLESPLTGQVTLSCIVDFAIVENGVAQVVDQSTRIVWLDLDQSRYAISDLGDTVIDAEWAQAMQSVRTGPEGFAPLSGRAGAFVCMLRGEDRQCLHGIDLARRVYAFATPVAQEGHTATALMHGRGRCAPAPDVAWPPAPGGEQ